MTKAKHYHERVRTRASSCLQDYRHSGASRNPAWCASDAESWTPASAGVTRQDGCEFHKYIEPSGQAFAVRDEGGVERLSRSARALGFNSGARALHPGVFWRSLSPHSLRDVSKPRGHSTQPLVDCSLSRTAYRRRPFSTLNRRHPDSASFTEQGDRLDTQH
jgi:hypothetical protein